MKKIVVCGDSFNVDDVDHPNIHWTAKLNDYDLVNLSIPGASNLAIRLQIDKAISFHPDFIIVSFTSCMRTIVKYSEKIHSTLLDRIYYPNGQKGFDLISFPYAGADQYNVLDSRQLDILHNYLAEFVDLDLLRAENYYIIKDGLETLSQSEIKFTFSLGGFDHKSFTNDINRFNFNKFDQFQCPINLWDYCNRKKQLRPWFHVKDHTIHDNLLEYYKCLIK